MYELTRETLDYLLDEMAEDQLDLLYSRGILLRLRLEAQPRPIDVLDEGWVQRAILQHIEAGKQSHKF